MVADRRLLSQEFLKRHGGIPFLFFFSVNRSLECFHFLPWQDVIFSPKVIIQTFTAAQYSHAAFAALLSASVTATPRITAEERISRTALLGQITQPKYNQPAPMSRN